jgi:hypothetical protein
MKKLYHSKKKIICFSIISVILMLQSCVVYNPYTQQQVTVPDIVQMSKDGLSSKAIIREIRQSHSQYALKAEQFANLRNEGVQDSVLNYMQKTHLDAVRRDQRINDSYSGWSGFSGYYGGFGYGWPYGLYGWGWGPTIIYSQHQYIRGGSHGGYHGGYKR